MNPDRIAIVVEAKGETPSRFATVATRAKATGLFLPVATLSLLMLSEPARLAAEPSIAADALRAAGLVFQA